MGSKVVPAPLSAETELHPNKVAPPTHIPGGKAA